MRIKMNFQTGKVTEHKLTPQDLKQAEINTAAELAEKAAEAQPEIDFRAEINAVSTLEDLKKVLLGQGPSGIRVQGKK